MDIKEALGKLDPKNDNHWTSDGLPLLEPLKLISGNPSLTRDVVTTAAPGFTRAIAAQAAPQAPTPDQRDPAMGNGDGAADSEGYDIAAVEEQIAALRRKLDNVRGEIELKQRALLPIQDELDKLLTVQENAKKTSSPAAIRKYLDRQNEVRDARARRLALVRETGVDLKALAAGLRAPVDAARLVRKGRR